MHDAGHAAAQVWPAFALVTGLVLVGVVAEADGLFAAAGAALDRLPLGARGLYLAALALVVVVTAVLNLDTSVLFLTPVLLHLARRRGLAEEPFLLGAVLMSNAGSLFLPGSNLTNLIVLHGGATSASAFFGRMLPAAAAAAATTAAVLLVRFHRSLAETAHAAAPPPEFRPRTGTAAVVVATVLVLVLPNPALPVLGIGIAAAVAARIARSRIHAAIDVRVLAGLFVLAVGLGWLGRVWNGPAHLIASAAAPWAAAGAALASVVVNNLPAAVLLTPHPPTHPTALLLGLNLGPNLAVTGSLSAILWLRVARSLGAKPSVRAYSAIGLVAVPLSVGAALLASGAA